MSVERENEEELVEIEKEIKKAAEHLHQTQKWIRIGVSGMQQAFGWAAITTAFVIAGMGEKVSMRGLFIIVVAYAPMIAMSVWASFKDDAAVTMSAGELERLRLKHARLLARSSRD